MATKNVADRAACAFVRDRAACAFVRLQAAYTSAIAALLTIRDNGPCDQGVVALWVDESEALNEVATSLFHARWDTELTGVAAETYDRWLNGPVVVDEEYAAAVEALNAQDTLEQRDYDLEAQEALNRLGWNNPSSAQEEWDNSGLTGDPFAVS